MDIVFAKNQVIIECATANQANPGFRFEVRILFDGVEVVKVKGYPDPDGFFSFDASRLLRDFLAPDLPAFNQTIISACSANMKLWNVIVKEYYGEPPTEQSSDTRAEKLALLGGLSFLDFPGNDFFAQNLETDGQFLTWQPNEKIVSKDQQEYLYFSTVNRSMSTVYLHVQAFFDDETDDTAQFVSISGLPHDQIIIVPAGYSQLNLEGLFPGKTIEKYKIWINSSGDPAGVVNRSEERIYIVDPDYHRSVKYFLYLNSLGAYETLRCTGNVETENQYDRLSGRQILPHGYTPTDRQYYQYDVRSRYNLTANTGYLYKGWKEHLQEFYQSESIYEILNGRFIPVELNSDKLSLPDFRVHTHFDEFEYRYAHDNNAYSRL